MSEMLRICGALAEATLANEPTWLASVIRVEGSAYRRPGARMLFGRDGLLAGSVSGGCVDRDVVRTGAWCCQRGPVVRSYDASADENEPGARAGCGGKLQVLIEPVSESLTEVLRVAGEQLELERRVALATIVTARSPGPRVAQRLLCTSAGAFGELSQSSSSSTLGAALSTALGSERARAESFAYGSCEALLEVIDPAPHCFIFGSGEDAVPVAHLARMLDWRVTVCARRKQFSVGNRFAALASVKIDSLRACVEALDRCARPIAIVMGHDYEHDRSVLSALLGSRARYVGVLGPARRTQRMPHELGALGAGASSRPDRVYGPAGLHLGAETSSEIALSMIAEAQAVLAGGDAGFLRDRPVGIHESRTPRPLSAREP